VLDAPDENRQVLVEYLQLMGTLTPGGQVNPQADNNWKIQPVPGVRMAFSSGSGGIRYLANHPGIRLVKDNGDGSALYTLGE
jgi:2',3'-cyclic-nucleotide 2'-phosphodiesterase/3'-nucleotidase